MRMTVGLAVFSGVPAASLDSPAHVEEALRRGVEAGGFSLHDLRVVRFEPQGVTAAAIVGESHLTIHTWPEEGRLFVDVASCSSEQSVTDALAAMLRAFEGARVEEQQIVRLAGARTSDA